MTFRVIATRGAPEFHMKHEYYTREHCMKFLGWDGGRVRFRGTGWSQRAGGLTRTIDFTPELYRWLAEQPKPAYAGDKDWSFAVTG